MYSWGAESASLYCNMLLMPLLNKMSYFYESDKYDSIFYFGQVIGDIARCAPLCKLSGTGSPYLPRYWLDANQTVQYTPVTIQLLLSLDTVYGAGLHSYSLYVSS